MKAWKVGVAVGAALMAGVAVVYAQMPFRVYVPLEGYDDIPLPTDYREPGEWVFGRLMYPPHPDSMFTRRYFRGGPPDWTRGGTSWTQDYPRADRHFASALRRLTRINARSVEQPVNLDDGDDVFNWPWLCAGEMGDWKLNDTQARKLRDYLNRGGFLVLDDFWGPSEWDRFEQSMRLVFPDRPLSEEIPNDDPIFHTVYDISERYQVLGQWSLRGGGGLGYRAVGTTAHWYGIKDDAGRIVVAISFNSDVGDSWEWADDPYYPEKFSALGIRLAVNYTIYSLTH
jgi:hypothetical protein